MRSPSSAARARSTSRPARVAQRRAPHAALAALAFLALLTGFAAAALAPEQASAATAKSKRCPKGAAAIGPASKPLACLPAKPVRASATLNLAAGAARKSPRGARRHAKATKLARRAFDYAHARLAAGQPLFDRAAPAQRQRGWARRMQRGGSTTISAPSGLGAVTSVKEGAGGAIEATFRNGDVRLTMTADDDQAISIDVRDKHGAGAYASFAGPVDVPRCPTAAGDVPSRFDRRITWGEATAAHGKRHVTQITAILDGPWHGYVGVGAKAERFDLALRAALEVRTFSEIASTGKLLRRDATRTYRVAIDRKAAPIGTSGRALVDLMRLRGPKGKRGSAEDRAIASSLVRLAADAIDDVSAALRDGDERWYEQRRCARTFIDSSRPSEVSKGATAEWQVRVTDAQGAIAADARWTPSSSCGALTAVAVQGPVLDVRVADTAGAWGPQPYAPACVAAEVTSTAGRAAPFSHQIEPLKPTDLRIEVKVTYREQMGPGIAETNMTGSGSVDLRWDQDLAEGTGAYAGTEWDGTIANPCGHDMTRSRGFSGAATVGAHRNDDGTITVAWTANERPLRMAFMAIVPPSGGTRAFYGEQPFCGTPKLAKTTTDLAVSITPLSGP